MLDSALHYAGRGWRIFPLRPRSKIPAIKGWRAAATNDPDQIAAWWDARPDCNVGLATGAGAAGSHGIVVLDPDGPEGMAALQALVREHGPLPRTLTARTANGYHLYFAGEDVRSTALGELHVRGHGGLTALPPSIHPSGHVYAWTDSAAPLAPLPEWIKAWRLNLTGSPVAGGLDLGAVPPHLAALQRRTIGAPPEPWSAHAEARLRSALAAVPADNYQTWLEVGMALHSLQWVRSDGSDIGQDIYDDWSATCVEKYASGVIEDKWQSFGQNGRTGIGIGTLFHLAGEHGWKGDVAPTPSPVLPQPSLDLPPYLNGTNGTHALPAALTATLATHGGIVFPDTDGRGRPKATCTNARLAIVGLGVECRHDAFHGKMLVGGRAVERWAGELTDPAVHVLRLMVHQTFGFDPGTQNTRDATEQCCLQHSFDPVVDYLDSCQWDGINRLDTWMADYMGASASPLVSAIGRLMLVAAVRRVRSPGVKWDQIVVFEGPEDTGKSTSLTILAGKENFSDQSILAHNEREQQEASQGVWLYEIAELAGMRRTDVERVKAFASRTHDRARPAYGHFRLDIPRRCIYVATTNEETYLKSETGNRRFWPVRTGHIKLDALARDRNQLWAEADIVEQTHGPLILPYELRGEALDAQAHRFDTDPWEPVIATWLRSAPGSTSSEEVLRDCLHIQAREQDRAGKLRACRVLERLGWIRYRQRDDDGSLHWRYRTR